jgi:prephenate dehydrogenase
MNRRFDIVTILGVGLLGGSLGLALKTRHMAGVIRGAGHRQTSLDTAVSVGAVDETYLDPIEAVRGADLIVVCTPAALVPQMLDTVRDACAARAAVTDVASTKASICAHVRATWPHPLRFVGSHPMAGSEKFGPEHAASDLYAGCVTILAAEDAAAEDAVDPDARQAVADLWTGVGASVVEMPPVLHDAVVARTSHIPHILAACVALLAARQPDVRPLVGQGFRDVTRIAASRPEIWRDICLTNRDAILAGLDEVAVEVEAVRRAIADDRAEVVERFFRAGREARREVLGE